MCTCISLLIKSRIGHAWQRTAFQKHYSQDQMEIEWMHYIEVPPSRIPTDAPVLLMSKYVPPIRIDKWTLTDALAASITSCLNGHVTGHVGGWSIRKTSEERDVWVGFTGCRATGVQETPIESDAWSHQAGVAAVAGTLQHSTVHATKVDLPGDLLAQ
jgi:hypothetical protein